MERDVIVFGTIVGFIGNFVKSGVGWIFYFLGYTKYTFEHIAGGAFVAKEYVKEPVSLAIGLIADEVLAGVMGVLILYIIRQTGKRSPIYKATIISVSLYIFIYGVLMALDVTRASLVTPLPNLLMLIPHIGYGLAVGLLIEKFDR